MLFWKWFNDRFSKYTHKNSSVSLKTSSIHCSRTRSLNILPQWKEFRVQWAKRCWHRVCLPAYKTGFCLDHESALPLLTTNKKIIAYYGCKRWQAENCEDWKMTNVYRSHFFWLGTELHCDWIQSSVYLDTFVKMSCVGVMHMYVCLPQF